jgi:hypothetical protein
MQLQVFAMIKLECMLCVIIFRFNIFTNMFFILNFIRLGGCLVNDKIVTYPYKFIKLNDIVLINPCFFKKIFNSFNISMYFSTQFYLGRKKFFLKKFGLITPKVLLNVPNYLKANYKILAVSL